MGLKLFKIEQKRVFFDKNGPKRVVFGLFFAILACIYNIQNGFLAQKQGFSLEMPLKKLPNFSYFPIFCKIALTACFYGISGKIAKKARP
jgi:hypothetical protein